jgi:hypothetical protein
MTQLLDVSDDRDNVRDDDPAVVVRLPTSGCPSSSDSAHRSWCRHLRRLGVFDPEHDRTCARP